jgi:cytochrome oxidase assembly protein ShyY1
MSKEVLIPREKNINGNKVAGFDVINPLYCYEGGKLSFKNAFEKTDPVKIERSAIIVNRGWIPAALRDKRSRPNEVNQRQLVKLTGTWRKGKNVHDYKVPNNPDANEWNNLCLEDIGIFWDLPNFDEAKFYYFQAVELKGENPVRSAVTPDKVDEICEDHYNWRWHESTNQTLYRGLGLASFVSFGLAMLAF